ncbi:MAG: hypothetical protein RLZZ70_18 [Candidatus Parcubacteria bacterium]|jgi:hypothetical protein
MFNFFTTGTKSSNIIIEVTKDALMINNQRITLPLPIEAFEPFFGPALEYRDGEYRWREYGISTSSTSPKKITHLTLHTAYDAMWAASKEEQSPFFTGKVIVDGKEIQNTLFSEIKNRHFEVSQFSYPREAKKPCLITIKYNKFYDPAYKAPEITKDTYVIKELNEEVIEFKDFGFKLAVIQELMYVQEILVPKLDVYQFVEFYDKRKIDIEVEGYDPIPEVLQYFKDLPIPKRLAPLVTKLYQDGSNEIYLNALVYGDGTETYWDIESTADLIHFPNLKKMTLVYAKEAVIAEFNALGVDAKPL